VRGGVEQFDEARAGDEGFRHAGKDA
jgi:hypothetical protein